MAAMSADEVMRAPATWRELAVARSLDSARSRAEGRVQRFLDAAVELMGDSGKDFTVQEVVERSGQSLRSFYQYFDGKHELLLALFEESVRATADHLRALVAGVDDPLDRLGRFAVEYHAVCVPEPLGAPKRRRPRAMAEFAQRLLTEHPGEAAQAFAPLVELLTELLEAAVAAGAVRPDPQPRRVAGVVLQAVMFHAFATTISGAAAGSTPEPAEALWDVLLHGIGLPPAIGTPACASG
jgi:AcrR family transcriptional regulator